MDENTPQPAPRRRRRALVAAITGAVAVAATIVGVVWLRTPSTHHEVVAAPQVVADRPPLPSPTVSAAAPRPTVPHDYVRPAVPTRFTLAGHGFTIKAQVCAMPAVFPLDPPGEQHHTVCWVQKGFGVKPGSRSATSYILGHSWAEDSQEVLNQASARATRDVLHTKARMLDGVPIYPAKSLVGARITLRTPQGTLVYAVRSAFGVDKLKLGSITRIMNEQIPKRVVVITCAELNGVDYEYNIILDARLIASRKAATT
jgi:hypothetical protein